MLLQKPTEEPLRSDTELRSCLVIRTTIRDSATAKQSVSGWNFLFDVPDEYCMIAELLPHATRGLCGTVRYPDAFFEEATGS